ncbi:MAG: undecaprenyldiphospho-muramoylpentapeptide beta-N-acetylglucosaminyltransferase [Odoribacteraceae bacterium]|jgi:UDP-N-acetylglucosamine--N-acetylmuramyl-(pentapeptide) pyrophosphoryl-undecaprenol N-acetylglucosamine transferase|nr:undecaprenyldiphospho-muramoylpentapeptide beta-N-acetylglucosaminyltransferase [Odoribacteraceae bacterium]
MKKIIISGGGTGGHVFPAIAIARALQRAGEVELLFVGAAGKMEMERVPAAGYPIVGLPVRGFRRRLTWENVRVAADLYKSLREARRIVKRFRPDAVVGVGGYASGPVCREAARAGIPLVLQEQNSHAGLTNRLLARHATSVCVAYEGMERFFEREKIVLAGNPVRAELLAAAGAREEALDFYGLERGKVTVLVTGGSLGARSLNNAMEAWLPRFAGWTDAQVLWQCGNLYREELEERLAGRLPANVVLTPFLQRMELAYACADVVVARAGACTISELALLGKAAVLAPSPNVAEDHQRKNARALVEKEAALMVEDSELDKKLGPLLAILVQLEGARVLLSERVRELAMADADERIARVILDACNAK